MRRKTLLVNVKQRLLYTRERDLRTPTTTNTFLLKIIMSAENSQQQSQQQQQQQQQQRATKQVAFLSMAQQSSSAWPIYDSLLVEPLSKKGFVVNPCVDWHKYAAIEWEKEFDVVCVRSTWDYQEHLEEFHAALKHIHACLERRGKNARELPESEKLSSSTSVAVFSPLQNDLEVMLWNSRKTYLLDLASSCSSVLIVPSVFLHERRCYENLLLSAAAGGEERKSATTATSSSSSSETTTTMSREEFDIIVHRSLELLPELLFKPIVGASSFGCYRLSREDLMVMMEEGEGNNNKKRKPFVFREDPVHLQLREGKLTELPPDSPKRVFSNDDDHDSSALLGGGTVEFDSKMDFLWSIVRHHDFHYILQPFLKTIQTHGEVSLFYFGEQLSHVMRKVPRHGDFRSQDEYDAEHTRLELDQLPSGLREAGDRVISEISRCCSSSSSFSFSSDAAASPSTSTPTSTAATPSSPPPLYCRVDVIPVDVERTVDVALQAQWGVCGWEEEKTTTKSKSKRKCMMEFEFAVMELELIEPSLYFNVCPEGIDNFVDEFTRRF